MKWIVTLATVLLSLGTMMPDTAMAQSAKDLVGNWSLVSVETVRADGSKFNPLGGPAQGVLTLDAEGRFSWQVIRTDIPKLASNNRLEGTTDEFKAVALGVLAYFGTYTVEDGGKALTMKIETSSFPNWNGVTQKRTVELANDHLTLINPAGAAGGTAYVRWKRNK